MLPAQIDIIPSIEQAIAQAIAFVPRLAGALIVLLVGWLVGRLVYRVLSRAIDSLEIDRAVMRTPLGRLLGDTERAVSRAFGRLGAWFVYGLAILTAADVLAVELLSEWIGTAVSYLPAFIAGALVIVIGFVLADFLADGVSRTETVTETGYTAYFADGLRGFLYFVAVVIGLDTMGVDVQILYLFASAVAAGVAVGLALALGIGLGWGSKDYVSEHIDEWVGSSPSPEGAIQADGGNDPAGED
jgi:small-conductance mechanosensitive channel